jgi:hypothetical protein
MSRLSKFFARLIARRRFSGLPACQILETPEPLSPEHWVTLVKCRTPLQADGVVRELKRVGIRSRIPGGVGIAVSWGAADLENHFPSIPVQTASKDFNRARRTLLARAARENRLINRAPRLNYLVKPAD